MQKFVAIDFETADTGRDSACAVGLVRVEGGQVVAREQRLIRPPRPSFQFTHVHGITWEDVRQCPPFSVVWQELLPVLEGVDFPPRTTHPSTGRCCRRAATLPG